MALIRPEPGGPLPERAAAPRGAQAVTASPPTPPTGCPYAVVAAAGCTLAQPFPGSGTDRHARSRAATRVPGRHARRALGTRAGGGGRP